MNYIVQIETNNETRTMTIETDAVVDINCCQDIFNGLIESKVEELVEDWVHWELVEAAE
jgi:hypothetical protein